MRPPRRRRFRALRLVAKLLVLALPAVSEAAIEPDTLPEPLKEVGFDQRLGESLPLDAVFTDENGGSRALGSYYGDKPVVIALVYYECPMLCSMVLNGVVASLRALEFSAGEEFEVLAVSFDPREGAALARAKKTNYVGSYGREGAEEGWHFLTGEREEIDRLTEAVGFRYVWDEERQEYAHAAGIVVTTPDGIISRYFYGIDFPPRDVRLGLVEAADSKIGNAIDQVLLFCFHYDPETGEYTMAALTALRIGAVLTMLALGSFLWIMFRRERRQRLALRTSPR